MVEDAGDSSAARVTRAQRFLNDRLPGPTGCSGLRESIPVVAFTPDLTIRIVQTSTDYEQEGDKRDYQVPAARAYAVLLLQGPLRVDADGPDFR